MGLAISGMHYTAMAAAKLAIGSYCLGGAAFDNGWLARTIGTRRARHPGLTLITAVYDAHLVSQTRQDAQRLEQVNSALQHGKNLLALATRAAGISSWELDIATRKTLWTENEIESLRAAGVDTRKHPDSIIEMTHPQDRTIMFDAIASAMTQRRETCTFRFRVVTPAGNAMHLEAHARIFCDVTGRPVRILGVSWDVTHQLQQEERKRDLQSQLRDASRDAGMAEVATGVLHSVGNVLNSLGVSAALLQPQLRDSRVSNVQRIATLLAEQKGIAPRFLESMSAAGSCRPISSSSASTSRREPALAVGIRGDCLSRRAHPQHRGRAADLRATRRRHRGGRHRRAAGWRRGNPFHGHDRRACDASTSRSCP